MSMATKILSGKKLAKKGHKVIFIIKDQSKKGLGINTIRVYTL